MSSINQIILKNIKFFHDETIKLSKNVLFYGENGSGKSSLYWALKVYFEHLTGIISKEKKDEFFNHSNPRNLLNRNYSDEEYELTVTPTFDVSKDTVHFVNHKTLSDIFSTEFDGTVDFFDILNHDLFKKYTLFDNLREKNLVIGTALDITGKNEFDTHLKKIIAKLQFNINRLMKNNFEEKSIKIKFKYIDTEIGVDALSSVSQVTKFPSIQIIVNKILNPQHHFNEAKLKLISLAIYFAIINLSKPTGYNGLRLAVFDDFLQSLDMSYRDVVLDYIFQNFQDYQIIMLTHDLMFYKLLKRKVKFYENEANWEYKNIYIRETITEATASIEPKVYDNPNGNDDYIGKARRALLENDFETCGNNCRKELERTIVNLTIELQVGKKAELQRFLDIFLKNSSEYTEYYFDPQAVIKTLLSAAIEPNAFKKVDLDQLRACLGKSEFYKDIVLNPSSHDEEGERYKKEFEAVIQNIEKLKQIIS